MKTKRLVTVARLSLAVLVCVLRAQAQNLVTNPGFEAGNTGFASDYTLWPGPAIDPNWGANQYFVTNNPHNAYRGWGSSGDHTQVLGRC